MDQTGKPQSGREESSLRKHRKSRHKRRTKKKFSFKFFRKWVRKNPLKTIAGFSILIILVLTILFYSYNMEMLMGIPINANKKDLVTGISIPINMKGRSSPFLINFGNITLSVSTDELRSGYIISPGKLYNCGKGEEINDRTKFTLYLVENQLFVTSDFRTLSNDSIAGYVNLTQWSTPGNNLLRFFSSDNAFQVVDTRENVIFQIQFVKPNLLSVNGYFSGANCVYVVSNDAIYLDNKEGNYKERAIPAMKKITRIR